MSDTALLNAVPCHLKPYLVAVRRAMNEGSKWSDWSETGPLTIEDARRNYDAGKAEMIQGNLYAGSGEDKRRIGVAQYLIPRKTQVRRHEGQRFSRGG